MNTPPPENEFPKLELLPSVSMPVLQPSKTDSSQPSVYRRRRHTITRPDSALELLSLSDSDDGEQDDQTLDRISGILSNLIQEANQAVQNHGSNTSSKTTSTLMKLRPRSAMLRSPPAHNNITLNSRPKSIQSFSRLPRPVWSSQQQQQQQQQQHYHRAHDRHSSISSSTSSCSLLFSPAPATESPITASSVEQTHYFLDQQKQDESSTRTSVPLCDDDSFGATDHTDLTDEDIITMDETQQTHDSYYEQDFTIRRTTDMAHQTIHQHRLDDPLMESFRRLDSSMAMVESLSRDLADDINFDDRPTTTTTTRSSPFTTPTSASRLTLLLLPLLHIPHALITTVFDTIISPSGNTSSFVNNNSSSPLSGIMAWTLCFALANMVVTWSGVPAPQWFRPRRLSLPGSYQQSMDRHLGMLRSKRPTPINTTLIVNKKPASHPARRTPIKRSTRKRITSHHHHQHHHKLSSTMMTTSHSNDRSYTLAIQQSRACQQQRVDDQESVEMIGFDTIRQQVRRRNSF
ncbi:hypothetical protein BC941DRAFT_450790 [Chlamydoabsidia padenii]|nr:hypothetical protein BC941DRAFT_450790 [Chlamydoabsidia padenii]